MVDSEAAVDFRAIPGVDALLTAPAAQAALRRYRPGLVKAIVTGVLAEVRAGRLAPDRITDAVAAALPDTPASMTPVYNATGVIVHTNLGRAPLSAAATEALRDAAGYSDVEFDLAAGQRAMRGRGAIAALLAAVPPAQAVHIVNNGAAALLLAASALAADREIILSRGEVVEIGDGFRLTDILSSAGARIREVGTTNRTALRDYADARGPDTACILKVHPSNFRVHGYTSSVSVAELATLAVPVVVDVGSGLLAPEASLPDEPDVASALRSGADLVIASCDKLLGGPQGGLLFGGSTLVERLRRHPISRALRPGKLILAALEATVIGREAPVWEAVHMPLDRLTARTRELVDALADRGVPAQVVPSEAVIGGGGAPGMVIASCAIALPAAWAARLRTGDPAVVGRIVKGRVLLDLRCVPPTADDRILAAVIRASGA